MVKFCFNGNVRKTRFVSDTSTNIAWKAKDCRWSEEEILLAFKRVEDIAQDDEDFAPASDHDTLDTNLTNVRDSNVLDMIFSFPPRLKL